jgi:arsenite/tail-anchored protein-transporting ATPase
VQHLLQRRVLLFGGKGGVGKTTCAAATALAASRRGRRVLLVSTDPAHSTSDIFERPFGATEQEILPSLVGLEIDPAAEARRYIADVKARAATLFKTSINTRALEQIDIAGSMPGIEDAALFDRVADVILTRAGDYDLVVLDTAPTGHTLQLLRMPAAMSGWLRALADSRRQMLPDDRTETDEIVAALDARIARLDALRTRLTSHRDTAFVLVLIPERLPLDETVRAAEQLEQSGLSLGGIVVNRVLPADAGGAFIEARRRQQQVYLSEIDRRFAGAHRVRIAERPSDVHGIDDLLAVAGSLFTELTARP